MGAAACVGRTAIRAWASGLLAAALLTACGGTSVGRAPVLLAAGDIAECPPVGAEATARLLDAYPHATVAPLGDNAYPDGASDEFSRCFGHSWGRHKGRMRPATGNHEFATKDARGFSSYFGRRGGPFDRYFYSYDLGRWHVVVLNSDCFRVGGCDIDEPQARWLRRDLREHRVTCTLAYWHLPPFSSGRHGNPRETAHTRPLWRVLVEEGADVLLTAHDHSYERFRPMDAAGRPDGRGVRLFVVGTGGAPLHRFRKPPLPTTAVRNDRTWGVLRLTLRSDGYDWKFLAVGETFSDAGSGSCH